MKSEVKAYADVKGYLHVWCEHCQRWHHHGRFDGHKVAHCSCIGSPYEATGYYLVIAGVWTKDLQREYKDKKPAICGGCKATISPKAPVICKRCGWEAKTRHCKRALVC